MEVIFHGGADEVGRSCIEAVDSRGRLLMDCGVKIGYNEEYPLIKRIPRNIVITHTHLDHAAYLPHIFGKKRNADIYLTKPTRDLLQLMIADYMRISRNNFGEHVLNNILTKCRPIEYGQTINCGMRFSLHNSGHILGSASVLVHSRGGNLLYTSDLNTRGSRITEGAEQGLKAKTLIIESTYGGKGDVLPPQKEVNEKLARLINRTVGRDGKVLIPSFAVGRAQELILMLDSYMKSGVIEPAPIYIDGMIKKALKIFRHNVIHARAELQRSILVSDSDPFKSRFVSIPKRLDRSDAIEEGSIIITTSGMMKGGPVMTYMKEMAGDRKNLLLFVGYQAAGTPGRRILDGERKIRANGSEVEVKMKVEKVGLSAHADHIGILQYIKGIRGLEKVFIVHGEESKRRELAESVQGRYDVILPKTGERFKS